MSASEPVKILLDENDVPREYYNILPDLPAPLPPPLHPATREPVPAAALEAIFPKALVAQEMSAEPRIRIPGEVRDALLRLGRPTPLVRAKRLESYLKTPAKIYFKNESLNPCGSHKANTAVAQAYYNAKEGVGQLYTETGAGQWGTALAYAGALFGLQVEVFMVKASFEQKPMRRTLMESYGAKVHASPGKRTRFGRKVLAARPGHPGSIGIAISEALEMVAANPGAKYSLGSVLNHVLLHQTVIGLEAKAQLQIAGDTPDVLIGCVGGGSNFAGFAFPFMQDRLKGTSSAKFVAVEPVSCPSTTKGRYEYDFGDAAGTTPLLKMHTLGRDFVPSPIHAGGLRFHGMAPAVSLLIDQGLVRPVAYPQAKTFEAGLLFAHTEGIVPAPESAHAISAVIDEALACRKSNAGKAIVFNLSGHGLLDLNGYRAYLDGELKD
ncbi:MAG: TrpB-like pyridoxal phosphate-dependent enzyme [Candidatus Micrarchaeota archaeon]